MKTNENITSKKEMETILAVRDVTVTFGGIVALQEVTFNIDPGEMLGLIGPNGAGKTTLFNCLSRLYTPSSGDIFFQGRSIMTRPVHRIAEIGIGRTFQNLAMFTKLSVLDNICLGGHCNTHSNFISDTLRLPRTRRMEKKILNAAFEIMDFLDLTELAHRPVGDLPFAIQKRVDMGRAIMTRPKLLLLDEPAAGLNHEEVEELASTIKRIRDERELTVLLVEHHMGLVMSISDRIVVLNFGCKIGEGLPEEIQRNPEVINAYLGG